MRSRGVNMIQAETLTRSERDRDTKRVYTVGKYISGVSRIAISNPCCVNANKISFNGIQGEKQTKYCACEGWWNRGKKRLVLVS